MFIFLFVAKNELRQRWKVEEVAADSTNRYIPHSNTLYSTTLDKDMAVLGPFLSFPALPIPSICLSLFIRSLFALSFVFIVEALNKNWDKERLDF